MKHFEDGLWWMRGALSNRAFEVVRDNKSSSGYSAGGNTKDSVHYAIQRLVFSVNKPNYDLDEPTTREYLCRATETVHLVPFNLLIW